MEDVDGVGIRRVALDPSRLGSKMAWVGNDPRHAMKLVAINSVHSIRCASIHPDQAGAERLASFRNRQTAIELPGDANSGDVIWLQCCGCEGIHDCRPQCALPYPRILFGMIGLGMDRRIASRTFTNNREAVIKNDGLEALGADVDAKEHGRNG